MVLPFTAWSIDRAAECFREAPMTRVHFSYFQLVKIGRKECSQFHISSSELILKEVKEFKEFVMRTLDMQCNNDLYTLKSHLLNCMLQDIDS